MVRWASPSGTRITAYL
jgi:hypothetical protein